MTSTVEKAERLHFCSPTPYGAVHLVWPARHGADAVGAALVLLDAESWLAALEQGLAVMLDPTPQPGPTHTHTHTHTHTQAHPGLVWCSGTGSAAPIRIGLPWQVLAQAPASALPELQGPEWLLHVDVARWPLPLPVPAPAPSAGGLLLLPASFHSPWCVTLVQADIGVEIDAFWAGPGHVPSLAGAPRAAVAGGARVRLQDTLRWPLAAVLGWCAPPQTPLGDAAQCWPDAAAAGCSGRIVPALGGAGLLVLAVPAPRAEPAQAHRVAAATRTAHTTHSHHGVA